MKNSPCHGCEERCILCHAHCDKYAEWTAEQQKLYDKRMSENESRTVAIDRSIRIKRYHRRHSK